MVGPDPELNILKKNFIMQNSGLISTHINEYFPKCSYGSEIRHLDLTNNKLHDISVIWNLANLESICLSKNFIREIIIGKPLPSLKKLVCFDNILEKVEGLMHSTNLKILNLGMNKLRRFPVTELKELKELILSFNNLQSVTELENC